MKYLSHLAKFAAVITTWMAWKQTASLSLCWLFWLCLLAVVAGIRPKGYGVLMLITGTASNAAVTLANGGVMPAVGAPITMRVMSPIWGLSSTHPNLLMLADHAAWGYFSVGDFCLQIGCLLVVVKFVYSKLGGKIKCYVNYGRMKQGRTLRNML